MTTEINKTGVPITDRGPQMSLPDGRWFHPLNPSADEVFIEDIALSLSRTIRYNGLSDRIINVAQHSCNASWIADVMGYSPETQLAMLMHDAAEYIVGDMIRPIKMECPGFQDMEDAVMAVIIERFNLPVITNELMKYFDNLALAWEKRDLFDQSRPWPGLPDVPEWCPTMKSWSHAYAHGRFIMMFKWLQMEIKSPPTKWRLSIISH